MQSSAPVHLSLNRCEAGVLIGVIVTLLLLLLPSGGTSYTNGHLTQALINAKQIHLATTRMALDDAVTPDPKLGWPGELPDITNVGEFAERLVEYKYFERGDLKPIFSAAQPPEKFFDKLFGRMKPAVGKPYSGTGLFRSENSIYKIYRVTNADVPQVIFIATKNFSIGQPLDAASVPHGSKGAVLIRKSGEGLKITDQQAARSGDGSLGFGVGGTSSENPGREGKPLL